ncbi:hypothetical protein F5Y03DRAFT_188168 [Xylaria venustula]|nr:hypothetical protein F5Y03DRAFT_188168 [Xylaria venustula]
MLPPFAAHPSNVTESVDLASLLLTYSRYCPGRPRPGYAEQERSRLPTHTWFHPPCACSLPLAFSVSPFAPQRPFFFVSLHLPTYLLITRPSSLTLVAIFPLFGSLFRFPASTPPHTRPKPFAPCTVSTVSRLTDTSVLSVCLSVCLGPASCRGSYCRGRSAIHTNSSLPAHYLHTHSCRHTPCMVPFNARVSTPS